MHKSLTEPLQLAGTIVSVCHHCKIGVHTGIPAAEPLHPMPRIIILNIIALAGRAYRRYRYHMPDMVLYKFSPIQENQTFSVLHSIPSFQRKMRIWKLFYHFMELLFFLLPVLLHLSPSASVKSSFTASVRAFPFFLSGLSSTVLPRPSRLPHLQPGSAHQYQIPCKNSFPPAHDRQSPPWFHALFLLVKSIHRIPKEHIVENFHTLDITSFHTKYNKFLFFQCLPAGCSYFFRLFTGIQVFTLWERNASLGDFTVFNVSISTSASLHSML